MNFLKTTDNRIIYFLYNGFYTAIDTQELSIVRTTFSEGSLTIGDKVCWWYGGDEEEMIITNSNGMEAAKAILHVLKTILPISNITWLN